VPTFSVIIPCYNRAGLIGQTLRSVLDGDKQPDEIIVVDDGSTDGSVDEVRAFAARVRLIPQENAGPGAARAHGSEQASGDYLCFLDSDDLWFPWTLATYLRVIEVNNEPAFVTGRQEEFTGRPPQRPEPPEAMRLATFEDYYASCDAWRWWSASSFVIQRTAYDQAGGMTRQWVNGEDCDLTMRLGVQPGFVSIEAPATFAWRRHEGSAMSNQQRAVAGARYLVQQENQGRYPGGSARRGERLTMLSTHLRPAIIDAARQGHRAAAWGLYRQTLGWHLKLQRWRFLLGFWKVMLAG